jgi:hypothetical protein
MSIQELIPLTSGDWREWGRPLLEGINRLLKSIYGRDVRLSQMLRESGVDSRRIDKWGGDRIWLMEFCANLERGLLGKLREVFPNCECRVLSRIHIDGWTVEKTAAEYALPVAEVSRVNADLLTYLRTKPGRTVLESIVLQAATGSPDGDRVSAGVSPSSKAFLSEWQSDDYGGILVGQFGETGEIVIYDPARQRGSKATEVYLYRMRHGRMASFDVETTREGVKRIDNEEVKQYALRAYRKWERDTGGVFWLNTPEEPRFDRVARCWNCGAYLETKRHAICRECRWLRCPDCEACGCGYEEIELW